MTTLVNLLHRFEQFVNAHQQITTFSHGQITDLDTFKETDFPVMHVVWNGATPTLENNGSGVMNWDFQVLFLDKPNINEDKTNQAKYVQSDCAQYALDLLATIRFGDIFDEDVEVASAGLQAITESFTNVLWGAALNLGLLTDYDVNYCDAPLDEISGGFTPCTLCGLIAGANAVQIVDCLSEAQEAAISALICPSTEPATYTNGSAFTQEIAAGETYTAPQVTMTAVDGTTEDIPANEDYVCEWKAITGQASDGFNVPSFDLAAYPTGGVKVVGDFRVNDAAGLFGEVPARERIVLPNATLSAAAAVSSSINLTIEVNVPVVNSNGDSVGSNVDDLLNPHVLPDLPVNDNDGAVGSYFMPTALVIDGTVDSASYTSGTLTITPAGSTPTDLIYQRSGFRGFQPTLVDYDLGWQVNAGTYNYGNGTGVRVSYGSGADRFYRVAPLNAFGNNLRYTDSVGGGAADTLAQWSTVDWALRPTAIPYYVIDHLTGLAWIIVKIGFAETWDAALATAHGFSYGGFSDYRIPSSGEIEDVYNGANVPQFYGSGNIFFRSSFFVAGTETGMWLNSYLTGSTTLANFFNDSGEVRLANRTTGTGRATYAVRTHYPAP